MIRQERRRLERKLREYTVIPTDEKLTASTGIGVLVEIFYKSPLFKELEKHLPKRVSHLSYGSSKLALTVLSGHLLGAESVEDLTELQDDEFLLSLFEGDVPAPRTILEYLNDFDSEMISGLNSFLNQMGKVLHGVLREEHPGQISEERILDIDSMYHIRYGELIEGVWWNYKKEWSLESQSAFSHLGFCHHVWLRPGNTKSGTDADVMIKNMFNDTITQEMRKRRELDFTRMDSAFCNQFVIKSCLSEGLFFTITANKATTFWHQEMEKQGIAWVPWVYSEKELLRAEKTGVALPKMELGRIWWQPSWSKEKLLFPIIIKRTWKSFCKIKDKKKSEQGAFFFADSVEQEGGWDYYAVVTNHDLHKESYQEIMQHHKKRASSENMNKEAKYGYRLNNLPCRALLANQAWFCFAMAAHNLLRFVSLMDDPENPHMAKKTRRKFINFPAKIQVRARKLWLKVPFNFYKGVIKIIEGWQFPEKVSAQMFSSA